MLILESLENGVTKEGVLLVFPRSANLSAVYPELFEQVDVVVGVHLARAQHLVVLTHRVTTLSEFSHKVQVTVLCSTSVTGVGVKS